MRKVFRDGFAKAGARRAVRPRLVFAGVPLLQDGARLGVDLRIWQELDSRRALGDMLSSCPVYKRRPLRSPPQAHPLLSTTTTARPRAPAPSIRSSDVAVSPSLHRSPHLVRLHLIAPLVSPALAPLACSSSLSLLALLPLLSLLSLASS